MWFSILSMNYSSLSLCIVWLYILRWYYGFSVKCGYGYWMCHQHIKIQKFRITVEQLKFFIKKRWHLSKWNSYDLFTHALTMRVIWHLSHFRISLSFHKKMQLVFYMPGVFLLLVLSFIYVKTQFLSEKTFLFFS